MKKINRQSTDSPLADKKNQIRSMQDQARHDWDAGAMPNQHFQLFSRHFSDLTIFKDNTYD